MDKKLFASVKVKNNGIKGELDYYITRHQTYGLEIVENFEGEDVEIETIENITKSKKEINRVLGIMSKEFVKPGAAEDILQDIKYK